MRAHRSTLAIGIISAMIGSTVHAQGVDVEAQLIEQGQYWQARGNNQRASEVWQKVLSLDKNQINALYGMGVISLKQNSPQQANTYLARLQALSPVPWQARQLMQDIALAKPENQTLLEEARRQADAGDRDKATATYRKLFNGQTPQGTIGREYYNNLAFNEAGWPEARKGMERLLQETPDDSILALFYAQQLARHEGSRAEGARMLAKLTKRPDIAGYAEESWRLALVWMGPPSAAQMPLFEEFLKAHPDDQQIREQMGKGRQQIAAGQQKTVTAAQQNPLIARGLQALDKGDLAEAEKAFQERLATNPDDRDALGGLGVIRQQQNRLVDAEQLLYRAVGKGGGQWKVAHDNVRYWLQIQQGRDLLAKGQTAQAQAAFAQATRLLPDDIQGRLVIADEQTNAGQYETALAGYRQVLKMQANNPAAIRGVANVLSQTGKADEALRMLNGLSPAEQAKFGGQGRLQALRATQEAGAAEERGDIASAQSAMREAVRYDPDNVWTTFSLARLYIKSGEPQKARETINAFVRTHRDNIEALYVSALLSVEMEQWADAQATMDLIPLNRRTAAMKQLNNQITLTRQVNQATTLAKSGQRQEALALLNRLELSVAGNADQTATLAAAYVDAGDAQRALSLMQPLVVPGSSPSPNVLLQYASILLAADEDAQVYSILSGLQNQQLNPATRKRYDDLQFQYRVRQAERLREGGDLVLAYDTLAPALLQRPDDIDATSALARMFVAAGNHVQALELYKPLVQRQPQNASLLLNTADVAVLAQDNAYAENVLKQFVKLKSTNPVALTEAARIYRTLGKTSEATTLLRQAVAIENSNKQRQLASKSGGIDLSVNPFRNLRKQAGADSVSTLPLPAERVLSRPAVAVASNGLPAPAEAQRRMQAATPVYAPSGYAPAAYVTAPNTPVYVAPQIDNRGANTSEAQRALFAMQTAPQVTAVASNVSPAQSALNEILQAQSAYVTQGVLIRSNASEPGLSQIDDIQAPLEVNMPVGSDRVVVRVTPTILNSGNMNDEAATRFGGGGASARGAGNQRASGVGLGVAYENTDAGFKADIGTTPLGFKYNNVVGGLGISKPLSGDSHGRYGLTLSRRAVTDSVTSFAGTTDRRADLSWGGVTANGGRADFSYDDAQEGVYGYGTLHRLMGRNVRSNTRVELGAGAYHYLENTPDEMLTAGVSTTILSYTNNQNFYTYGHGGYFSPQAYLAVGVPVTWSKRSDNFTFQLKGSLGVQYFRQDGAAYFPTDNNLQGASGMRYSSQTKTGLGYGLEGGGEYRFGPRVFIGGALRLNNSNDFREINAGMYVRYTMEDMRSKMMTLPVSPYRSPYSN